MKPGDPLVMVMPITYRCNGRCVMCGVWRSHLKPDVDVRNIEKIFSDEHLASSLTHLNITGGEPFLHPGLLKIADIISNNLKNVSEININTSGICADGFDLLFVEFYKRLKAGTKLNVSISLDGVGKMHDNVRGIDGVFRAVIETIKKFQKACSVYSNASVNINCTFSALNFIGVKDVIKLVDGLGLNVSLTYACVNDLYLRNNKYKDRFQFTENDFPSLIQCINEWLAFDNISFTEKHYLRMLASMLSGQKRSSSCVYQGRGLFLDVDGLVYPCGTVRTLVYGSIRKNLFKELCFNKESDEIREELKRKSCPTCLSNSYYGLGKGTWLRVLKDRRNRS